MTIVENYRNYVIIRDHREYGVFDPFIGMINHWFKTKKEAEIQIDVMED